MAAPTAGDLFGKHLISERSLALFQSVQLQWFDSSLATTFAKRVG
jgi:hypothetical protein